MCKNVKVYIGDGVSLPIEQVEKSLDPAELGIPGVCVPDNGNGPTGLTSLVRLRGQKSASSGGTSTQAAPQLDDDAATPIAAATTASVSTTAPATTTASASSGLLTSDQELFGARLVADTGLDPQVVAAWMYAEENGSAAQDRQASDNNDWLNIGFTGPATFGGGDSIWSSPITAADATAGWMAGRATVPGYDPTKDESILAILGTAGQPPLAQLSAIEKSDWASSHYNFDLVNVYLLLTGVKLPSVAGGTLTATGSGGTLTLAELTSEMPTITQAELSHVTTQDLENAVPQLEAALGVTSAQTTSELLPAGSGPAGAQRMLAAAQAVIGATYNQGNHDDVSESEATVRQLGTDCSGFVSWLIGPNGAGLWSQTYTTVTMSQAPNLEPGTGTAGHYVTIYNNPLPGNAGHVFIDIEGRWFEDAGGIGVHQMDASEVQSYLESGQYTQIFHPVGM